MVLSSVQISNYYVDTRYTGRFEYSKEKPQCHQLREILVKSSAQSHCAQNDNTDAGIFAYREPLDEELVWSLIDQVTEKVYRAQLAEL